MTLSQVLFIIYTFWHLEKVIWPTFRPDKTHSLCDVTAVNCKQIAAKYTLDPLIAWKNA